MFHCGTKLTDGVLKTDGGRVLTVVAIRNSLQDAASAAYEGVDAVEFYDMYYRRDIARR